MMNWAAAEWVLNRVSPKRRFYALGDLIERAMTGLSHDHGFLLDPPKINSVSRALIREVALILDELKIPHPPLDPPHAPTDWHRFLPRLLAAARARKFEVAKQEWPLKESRTP